MIYIGVLNNSHSKGCWNVKSPNYMYIWMLNAMRVFVNVNIFRTCQIQDGGHFKIYTKMGFLPDICSHANPPKRSKYILF